MFRLPTSLGVAVAIAVATAGKPGAAPAQQAKPAVVATTVAGNAAPFYRMAIDRMEADPTVAELQLESPIDAASTAALRRARPVLEMLHQAAAMPECDWPEPYALAETATLGKLRALASVGLFEARVDLAEKRPAKAADDMLAVMALGRHVGQTPLFISKLVEIGVTEQAIEQLASALPGLPKETVATLGAKLDRLPRGSTFAETILAEHAYARDVNKRGEFAPAVWEDATIQQVKPWYIAVADAAAQSPEEFARAVDAATANLPEGPTRAFASIVAPAIKPLRVPMAAAEAHEAMLRTAIDVVVNGPEAVKRSRDPFGTGSFTYRALPGGFELTSKLKARGGRPVTLQVGAAAAGA
ncbi:MAG: hypothetical protein ABIP55_14530 [Tepidisphaeraceae bacterium]